MRDYGIPELEKEQEREEYTKIKFLMQILKNADDQKYDIHLLTKALNLISLYHTRKWRETKLLYFSGIMKNLKTIISFGEMSTSREGALLCSKIMQNPDDMVLWLKFANPKLTVNSACSNDFIIQWGDPYRLPEGRGLYRNWGAFFDFGDVLEITSGI